MHETAPRFARGSRRSTYLRFLVLIIVAALSGGVAMSMSPPSDATSVLWPQPRQIGPVTRLRLRLPIRIAAPHELAAPAALLQREVDGLFGPAKAGRGGTLVRLTLAPKDLPRPEEYAVEPSAQDVLLRAHDTQGSFWAVHTLSALLARARRTARGYEVTVPAIRDWPDTQFRAFMFEGAWIHSLDDYKRALELLARQHITYFAAEFGPQVVLDFDPTLAKGQRFTKAQARAVIDYGRSLGLKPIAYLNLLGHLDRSYQKEPYTQHGGLDLRNEETYDKFVYPIIDEMLQIYGPVEYFHCGMDEAWDLFTWLSQNGYDVTDLIAQHITRLDSYLKARGVKLVIWHDMLIAPDLAKQLGAPVGPANGGPPQNTAAALAKIPKDVIIDYWFYDPLPAYPALDYLRSQGFTVWASPWQTPFSLVRYAQARHIPTLGTLWSDPPGCFGSPALSPVTAFYAQATWNAAAAPDVVKPEPALAAAAQRAVNSVLWRRRTLTFPSDTALLLSPAGPTRERVRGAPEQFFGVPLARDHPVPLAPLPENSKPLTSAEGAARVHLLGGADLVLDGVNADRHENQLILYAAPREKTGTNIYGAEAMIDADGVVREVSDGVGDHAIPPGGFVLSGHGRSAGRVTSLRVGDRVAVLDAQGNWLGGREPAQLLLKQGGQRQGLEEALAARTRTFPVHARCTAFYLAVTSDHRSSPGTPFGEWQVRYADGEVERIPLRYGREILSTQGDSLPTHLEDPVWMIQPTASSPALVREWTNPHPEQVVTDLVFVPAPALLETGAHIVAATAAPAP